MVEPDLKQTYYDILRVSRDAPPEVIRGSYRSLMQQCGVHPDRGGDAETAALINRAYAVLSDAAQRSDYDARLAILSRIAMGFEQPASTPNPAEQRRPVDRDRACAFCELPHDRGTIVEADSLCVHCASPLCVADNLRLEPDDQRAIARISKRFDLTYFLHRHQKQGFSGQTEDVSLNGLKMITRRLVPRGQRIRIASRVIEAVGTITHCAPRRRGWHTEHVSGVSFLTLRLLRSSGAFLSRRI